MFNGKCLLICCFVVVSIYSNLIAQLDVVEADLSCETRILSVERVFRSAVENKERIFIISRRSKTEQRGVDWARLNYVRTVLTQFKNVPSTSLTISEGELSEEKYGKIEFWVGSELQLIAYLQRNHRFVFKFVSYQLWTEKLNLGWAKTEQVSRMTYVYDGEAFTFESNQVPALNTATHDTAGYPSTFITGRGNLTSVTRHDVTGQTAAVTSKTRYDIAG